MNVWLIMGGMSAEREVSLETGRAVAAALLAGGHRVWAYDLRDGSYFCDISSPDAARLAEGVVSAAGIRAEAGWAERLLGHASHHRREGAEVAFLALHGEEGEGGTVQAILDAASVPYTGSGPTASAVAMDKSLSKWIMEALGIPTPKWLRVPVPAGKGAESDSRLEMPPLEIIARARIDGLPVVVKPVAQGSSVGITIVHEEEQWVPALQEAAAWSATGPGSCAQVLVEEYIPGRELTVGIVAGKPLPVIEIRPRTGFYDYKRKYTPGASDYIVPADLPREDAQRITDQSVRLYGAIGARGVARVDYRMTPGGSEYCLELNTIPGLTATSLIPNAAASVGMRFLALLEAACADALGR